MNKTLVILSGGQDSTTCLYWAKQQTNDVFALTFDYGQTHSLELASAAKIAADARVKHEIISIGHIFGGNSPLTNKQFAVKSYGSAQELPGGLEDTFVPGRNILFLTLAANRAYVLGCDTLVIGIAQEDYGGYPDCRREFIEHMEKALSSGLGQSLHICTPLMDMDKAQTVKLAAGIPGCLEALAHTTTCYNGTFPPCQSCHACLLRQRGFAQSGIDDPLLQRAAVLHK